MVLVGPNASGKSTVLEVIDFLIRCADDGLENAIRAHGGIASIRSADSRGSTEFESRWKFLIQLKLPDDTTLSVDFDIRWKFAIEEIGGGAVRVALETMSNQGSTEAIETEHGVRLAKPLGGGETSRIPPSPWLTWEVLADEKRFPSLSYLKRFLRSSRVIGALPTSPSWAVDDQGRGSLRDSLVIAPTLQLSRQGLGLANMLYHMSTEHDPLWKLLEKSFRGEFPFVKRLLFPADPGGGKISFAFEDVRFPGRKFYASEMSDGMVAYLCLLAAILNPWQVGVLALDEPDAHLHPSALRRFMNLLHLPGKNHSILLATHSNNLLEELKSPAESIRIVDSTSKGTRVRQLDSEALATWRQEYTLPELRRTGLLDHANSEYGKDE